MSKKKSSQRGAQAAFQKSDKHTFDGQLLAPWTPERVIAGQSMGMAWPIEVDYQRFKRVGNYPGALKDTVIALWLCTIPDTAPLMTEEQKEKQWGVDVADADPLTAYIQAQKWAKAKGITDQKTQKFYDAYEIFLRMVVYEPRDSATKPKGENEREYDPNE